MGDGDNNLPLFNFMSMNPFGSIDDDDQDDGVAPEDPFGQSAQTVEPPSWPQAPTKDPSAMIDDGRKRLIDEIDGDKDSCWADEKKWDQLKNYAQYRETIMQLLSLEKQHANILDTPFAGVSSGQRPGNLLQYVLEKALKFASLPRWRPQLKFLLRMIADVDPDQLSPKWGKKPLHAAAEVDIEAGRTSDSDLTIYVCNLMQDAKAAAALAETNAKKENIIHLAVYHDLRGVLTLIDKASEAAFRARRCSRDDAQKALPDDGNTPLHDAVDFNRHFLAPGPECSTSLPGKKSSDAAGATRRPSSAQEQPATSASNAQPQANQARTRTGQPVTPTKGVCNVCETAIRRKNEILKTRRKIVGRLVNKCDKAQMIHNSAGFSPYLYLLASSQKSKAGQPEGTTEAPAANTERQEPVPGVNRQMTLDNAGPSGRVGPAGDVADEKDREKREQEEKLQGEKKLLSQQAKPPSGRPGGADSGSTHTREGRNAAGVKEPVKNVLSKTHIHKEGDLKRADIGSDSILTGFMITTFWLGGYEQACDCLFPGQGSQSSSHRRESGLQRRFSLEAPKRVQDDTTHNYAFLLFEPMMADVDLSLEYSQEEMKALPNDEKKKLEIWRQDESNLVEFFRWLREEKGVTSILRLTVRDNPNHYCSDHTVQKCLSFFEIRYLNWVRPNLWASIHTLPNTLIELSLYWRGLNAVLWSWSAAEGLQTLEQLRVVRLFVQRGPDDETEQDQKCEEFASRVKQWKRRTDLQSPRVEIADDESRLRRGGASGDEPGAHFKFPKHPWILTAGKFGEELANIYTDIASLKKAGRYIKVALLDDGVDPTYDHIGLNLHYDGWTPMDSRGPGGDAQSFYASTHQHGTKMAWLIRKVCPFVTIYVAKLGVTGGDDLQRRSFGLLEATRAIDWAREQGVDIISMSWNAREVLSPISNRNDILGLETAIDRAAAEGIIMFGAACDLKASSPMEKWVPCDHQKVWSIGATDRDFDPKKYVDTGKKLDFLFPGESVLESRRIEDIEVGNSGATALASGLAAVILFCMKVQDKDIPDKTRKHQWMGKVMASVFKSDQHNRSVRVDDVLHVDKEKGLAPLASRFEWP